MMASTSNDGNFLLVLGGRQHTISDCAGSPHKRTIRKGDISAPERDRFRVLLDAPQPQG
jgi:hypothetical protein